MRIIDLEPGNEAAIEQAAELLIEEFAFTGTADWRDMDSAVQEVIESLEADRISRTAIDEDGSVQGWIGGIRGYEGKAWEIHPLVVRRDRQGRGLGRALVEDFEELVRQRGAWTVWVGTDDENARTSLGGIDLYPEPLAALTEIQNLGGHPFAFYRQLGYTVVGVLPDANGFGKPDILMAKRVRPREREP